jgi:multiple sugar transport system permease protein
MRARGPRGLHAALLYAAACALLLIFCGPLLWMLSQAFKSMPEIVTSPYDALPRQFTLSNFSAALQGGQNNDVRLARNFINTLIYAGGSLLSNVALGLMAGYAFARLRFPLRRVLFGLVLVAMMVPTAAVIIPLFMVVRTVSIGGGSQGWINSFQGLIVPTAVTGLTIVLMRQFLRGIPRELDEAAAIDGCGPIAILVHVIAPLSGTAIASVATLTFLARWDDYLWPSVVAVTPDMFTLQVGLRFIEANYGMQWPLLMASCTLVALPVILLYVALQPLFDMGLASLGSGWEA